MNSPGGRPPADVLEDHHVPPGSRLLVAVSGGPDSVALLHMLKHAGRPVIVGHIDHALRPSSRADAQFVARLAHSWDLPFLVSRYPVAGYARSHQMGIEEAAREVRYRKLLQFARRVHCQWIVTGHTQNDQAETVLMNFLRGAGGAGLAGIPPVRPVSPGSGVGLVRPLLGWPRSAVLAYLRQHRLPFRNDPTNRSVSYTRNRLRHRLLPLLDKSNPGLPERLAQTADLFRQEEDYWAKEVAVCAQKTVRKYARGWAVVLPRLFGYHKALVRRTIRSLLPGATYQDIEQVLQLARAEKDTGILNLSGAWSVRRKKKTLVVLKKRNQ